jgi:hypothetical protein
VVKSHKDEVAFDLRHRAADQAARTDHPWSGGGAIRIDGDASSCGHLDEVRLRLPHRNPHLAAPPRAGNVAVEHV